MDWNNIKIKEGMKVSDYVNDAFYNAGAEHVFLLTGGMIMHLTDSIIRHPKQKYICCHHEQSVVMAAESYGRYTGKLGLAYVTAGPGALNTLNSVAGAFVDSSPCIVVSGQAKLSQIVVKGPRQFALQGFHTTPIFSQVTKYAAMIDDISKVRYCVERAIYEAKNGRWGPIWLEIPIDIQGAIFNPEEYEGFTPPEEIREEIDIKSIISLLKKAERPLLLVGAGVRASGAIEVLHKLLEKTNIPVLTSRLGMDLIDYNHPCFVGRPGTYGDRAANFAIQSCDLLINIGCRLSIGLVGYDFAEFAKNAIKVSVDIDKKELDKPSVIPNIKINANALDFLNILLENLDGYKVKNQKWIDKTKYWKEHYPVDLPEYINQKDGINSYHFMRIFSEMVDKNNDFLLDTGSCFHVFAQSFKVKFGQRCIITGGLSTMGYTSAAIGLATINSKTTYCITGDGSFQFNIQELQTIVQNKLKIKFIVLNNNGYLLIRITQRNFMQGRMIGVDEKSGLSCPDLEKIAYAYGIKFIRIHNLTEMEAKIKEMQELDEAVICEIMTPENQLLQPRVASKQLPNGQMVSMAYDNMFPFLSEEEYKLNKII